MAYRDNVNALAAKLGISNDPGLREEDMQVIQVSFIRRGGRVINIKATPMNMGGRLFFQHIATRNAEEPDDWYGIQEMTDDLRKKAQEYFAELWEPNPIPGKRKMPDAIRDPEVIEINIFKK